MTKADFVSFFQESIMQNILGPLINLYQTQLDVSRKCADAVLSGTERIDHVVIGATHRMFNEQMHFVQAMASAGDPRTVGNALQTSFTQHAPDDAMNYQKEIMRIFADMQNEIGRSLQGYAQQFGGNAAAASRPLQSVQEQANDTMFNPMTSMFSVWESAFKDVAALAKRNMAAAHSATEEAMAATGQAANDFANVATAAAATGRNTAAVVGHSSADKKGSGSPSGGHKKK